MPNNKTEYNTTKEFI